VRFSRFLVESLDVLADEVAPFQRELADLFAGRGVNIRVDGDEIGLVARDGRVRVDAPWPAPHVELTSDTSSILAVLDGEVTLADAVLEDRLVVRGALPDVVAFHDGLAVYVHGAVRAPSFADLLRRFRG
jgi:hypothetical protein